MVATRKEKPCPDDAANPLVTQLWRDFWRHVFGAFARRRFVSPGGFPAPETVFAARYPFDFHRTLGQYYFYT
jgi:hypothetical protein